MIQKLADQLSTLLVVTLVILFCASGMTSCYHKKQPTSEPAASTEPTAYTPFSQVVCTVLERVSTRTSWPRASSWRRRARMDATTPFTAGVYQSDVMSIFMEEAPPVRIALRQGPRPVWGSVPLPHTF